jgi:glycosyltransferase involved in cell wall biosynthesis
MTESYLHKGISVIICCYNSSKRLMATLLALSRQEFSLSIQWELIIVDNASTDDTAKFADRCWSNLQTGVPLKIIHEPKPGLNYARKRGISEAIHPYLIFCDDDNHLMPGYLQGMYQNLNSNPDVAACGGRGIPLFETSKPDWFDQYEEAFATGSQQISSENGKVTNLYGAGLGIKKAVLEEIQSCGFKPVMVGRTGKKLSSADDTELTYAIVIRGFRLMYDDKLCFYHFLTEGRLKKSYIENLMVNFGHDGPLRNLYFAYISESAFHKYLKNWYFHLGLCLVRFLKYQVSPPKVNGRRIYLQWSIAYLKSLLAMKSEYAAYKDNIGKLLKTRPVSESIIASTSQQMVDWPESTAINI